MYVSKEIKTFTCTKLFYVARDTYNGCFLDKGNICTSVKDECRRIESLERRKFIVHARTSL